MGWVLFPDKPSEMFCFKHHVKFDTDWNWFQLPYQKAFNSDELDTGAKIIANARICGAFRKNNVKEACDVLIQLIQNHL